MKNKVFCVGLATILAACTTAERQAPQLAERDDGKCHRYGAQPGSPV